MQWLRYQNQSSVDNINNVRREAIDISRKRGRNTCKLNLLNLKLTVNKKYQEFRSINDFRKCYQPRNKRVNDEKVDLATDPHIIGLHVETISLTY
jgi:hypothetical protein